MKDRNSVIKRSDKASALTDRVEERLALSLRFKDAILPHSAPTDVQDFSCVISSNNSLKKTRLVVPIDTMKLIVGTEQLSGTMYTALLLNSDR